MRYLSVCSGIEAASVAWHPLGWTPVAFSEIEPFPAAVLAHHYPNVPNWGDMTKYKEWPDAAFDVLVGGTPCQSFSVAGLRKGLADPRGNLMLVYGAIAERYRPTWLAWENVPGVLSSNGGRDFGTFLGMLAELGYGFAYRVLDAQYVRVERYNRAVPQRRRRVFVVGHLGDWRRAAAVLFERYSLSGNPAPSRKTGERVAPTVTIGPPFSRTGNERVECEAMVPVGLDEEQNAVIDGFGTLKAREKGGGFEGIVCMAHGQANAEIQTERSPALTCNHEAPIVSFGIYGNAIGRQDHNGCNALFAEEISPCQTKTDVHAVAYLKGDNNGRMDGRTPEGEADISRGCLRNMQSGEVGSPPQERGLEGSPPGESSEVVQELPHESAPDGEGVSNMWEASQGSRFLRHALSEIQDPRRPDETGMEYTEVVQRGRMQCDKSCPRSMQQACTTNEKRDIGQGAKDQVRMCQGKVDPIMAIRRLTPTECCRLQGFPDGYTNIPWRGKTESPDGPRYKALGNSMAVNCMRWIGERIQMVEGL